MIPSISSIARPSGRTSISLVMKSVSGQSDCTCNVTRTLPAILDPGARRIEHGRLVGQRRRLVLQPIAEPLEIGIARPEILGIDEVVLIRADPQFLRAGACLDVLKRRDDAGLEDVEPAGDVK